MRRCLYLQGRVTFSLVILLNLTGTPVEQLSVKESYMPKESSKKRDTSSQLFQSGNSKRKQSIQQSLIQQRCFSFNCGLNIHQENGHF